MLYIMTLVGFGIGAALIITGLIIPPRKARVSIRVITVLVGLWTITELTLWSLGIPTISNRMVRIAARAPVVHLNQELLDYRGTVEVASVSPWKQSDEGIQLWLSPVYANGPVPPWAYLYVSDGKGRYFRYSRTKAHPWND